MRRLIANTSPRFAIRRMNQFETTVSSALELFITNHAEPALTSKPTNIHTKAAVRKPSRGTAVVRTSTAPDKVFGAFQEGPEPPW
jgi:hypothetical protein